MSADSPRHVRSGGPLIVPSQPPSDRGLIDAVSGFINDVTLSSSSNVDPKDVIQWARFETADINEPTPEGDSDKDVSPLLLILGYGSGVQVWLIPNSGEAQEVLSWRQGTVRVLRILPTPQHGDCFASKRPLIALCDSASPGPTFCSLSFISIRGGEQVKSIKFKNPILDVLANKRSVVVSFSERFAVFDAASLEDRLAVTTCYPCPCPLGGSSPVNPLALGDRWLAYADKKLNPSKRSSGGCEGEGVTSYTATVLHAAKSLSKGLRGLGESVAHSLAGRSASQSPSPPHADTQQPGVVTILDIEGNEDEDGQENEEPCDPIVAHFVAHSEAIIALKFDASGMLLVTADRRGHDFHVFRINPHPFGPTLASVHHLYILHRGDTTAKVQDIALSADSRWTAISTLRGTTHVFAISPYGGACGVRTHTQPRVVNRLSRFHRSAGLPIHSATHAHSPVCESGWTGSASGQGPWYPNPRLPPFPAPTITQPLAQLRPTSNLPTHTITRNSSALPPSSPLLQTLSCRRCVEVCMSEEERWLSQVEIVTHAGPHRRLWMGPQFVFKTYNCTGSNSSLSEAETVEVEAGARGAARSTPVNMPGARPVVPVLIDSGSASIDDLVFHLFTFQFPRKSLLAESGRASCDVQLREDLAEANEEDHGWEREREREREETSERAGRSPGVVRAVNPRGTVAVPLAEAAPAPLDPDSYTTSNADEATFRPVVRAPASLPLQPDLPLRPLPRTTTIPVENVSPLPHLSPDEIHPLNTDVIIPAALNVENWLSDNFASNDVATDIRRSQNVGGQVPQKVDRNNVEVNLSKDLDSEEMECKRDVRESSSANVELECEVKTKSLPKSNRSSDDIQPTTRIRCKKSPTKLPVSEKAASDISFKNNKKSDVDNKSTKDCEKDREEKKLNVGIRSTDDNLIKKGESAAKRSKEFGDKKELKEVKETLQVPHKCMLDVEKQCDKEAKPINRDAEKHCHIEAKPISSEAIETKTNKPSKPDFDIGPSNAIKENRILETINKNEKKPWDTATIETKNTKIEEPSLLSKENEDIKTKTKKSRKTRKTQEDTNAKDDEDSFVEIHNIEEDTQSADTGELVSISSPFEEYEPSTSFLSKNKKSRSPKINEGNGHEQNLEEAIRETEQITKSKQSIHSDINKSEFDLLSDFRSIKKENTRKFSTIEIVNFESSEGKFLDEISCSIGKEKTAKTKSQLPSNASQLEEISASESKEVYVINTTEDDFPDIQITIANKPRKKSPQPTVDANNDSKATVKAPIKSWSTIAASKNVKKPETDKNVIPTETTVKKNNVEDEIMFKREVLTASIPIETSLQEKLAELCKRTDIIVAECGEPSGLNFVEEHHSVIQELPPLDGLGFGLDEFKLEVMKDSLLEVADVKVESPICKISLDDILTSMKDTTDKVIESNTFNLIDIEKTPIKKGKGCSVIETDKITSQEVKIDEEGKSEKDNEVMEKSSDDDVTSPVLSTDSDKEEKKGNAGGGRFEAEAEELSSSSFSSASRASLDPPSSPTPSCSGDNLMHFPGDSSSSV
ncbi:Breast carcinoma-amplified sequence 3-like [Papilio machaon]|uniref:Breast carcinoma-amplified sequence 3-like n=1 Tax=Papilio machaon TaxID=76193 RepID=A0A194QZ12_PAPMA|nr:Breast carcinoma-amplified sequence 3-like [Papilio machaon]